MWIVSSFKIVLCIFLAGFILGFFCGANANRAHAGVIYISAEVKTVAAVEHGDGLADLFFTPENVDTLGGVAALGNEFAALHVEQGIANIPEPSTWTMIALGFAALAYRRRYWQAWLLTLLLATSAHAADRPCALADATGRCIITFPQQADVSDYGRELESWLGVRLGSSVTIPCDEFNYQHGHCL